MKDFEKVQDIKRAAQGGLLALPGVHGVGVGPKIVGGQPTQEISIMVYLVKKKPLSELRPEEVIPPEIDGVKTDVIESDVFCLCEDTSKYRPLVGGCLITPGGFTPDTGNPPNVVVGGGLGLFGTLGCLARTGGASPKIVALTCHHVVAFSRGQNNTLNLDNTLTFVGTNTPGTVVMFSLKTTDVGYFAFYQTEASDTLGSIAAAFASRIDSSTPEDVHASATGSQLQLQLPAGSSTNLAIFSAPAKNTWADIRTTVQGKVISASGRASRACAAYVTVNTGGLHPTAGVFVPIKAGDDSKVVINSISTAITKAAIPTGFLLELVTAAVSGGAVTFTGTQEIECAVSSDLRVGQPQNTMTVAPFLNDQIGVILDAHEDVDVALIELDPGLKYRADILDIGPNGVPGAVKGIHNLSLADFVFPLKKRGFKTGLTNGTLKSLDFDGFSKGKDGQGHLVSPVHYTGAFVINGAFAASGDSGAAVLNDKNEVVGILFAATQTDVAATPIKAILDSFATLNLTIETAAQPGIDKVVP